MLKYMTLCRLLPLLMGCPNPFLLGRKLMGRLSPFLLVGHRLGHCLGLGGVLDSLEAPRLWGQWGESRGRVGWGEVQGYRPGEKAGGNCSHTEVEFGIVEFVLAPWGFAEVDSWVGVGGLCWH